jgi:uncharacterized protein
MIAVDTNILVYAHRRDTDFHAAAAEQVKELAEGRSAWAIPWPCVHEFFAITTHPKIYDPPSTREQATRQVEAWLASPTLSLLGEPAGYWDHLKALIDGGKVVGPMVHDAHRGAVCSARCARAVVGRSRFRAVQRQPHGAESAPGLSPRMPRAPRSQTSHTRAVRAFAARTPRADGRTASARTDRQRTNATIHRSTPVRSAEHTASTIEDREDPLQY